MNHVERLAMHKAFLDSPDTSSGQRQDSEVIVRLIEENARLREALVNLERLSGIAMMSDDPARVEARAALEETDAS